MKNSKDTLILLFLLLAAVVIGGVVAELTAGIPALAWLTYGEKIGFNYGNTEPLLDLAVIKLNFGFQMNVSVLQIILICIALLLYRKVR